MDIIKYILIATLSVFGIYLLSRLISYAVAKSWFQVSLQQKREDQNEKKEIKKQ